MSSVGRFVPLPVWISGGPVRPENETIPDDAARRTLSRCDDVDPPAPAFDPYIDIDPATARVELIQVEAPDLRRRRQQVLRPGSQLVERSGQRRLALGDRGSTAFEHMQPLPV